MNDQDLLFDGEAPQLICEAGTIGWPDDDVQFELGDETNDGNTLVKVTLLRGHPLGEPRTPDGRANGFTITAQLMAPFWRIPRVGERCYVIFPQGFGLAPGAGLVLPLQKNPLRQFSEDTAMQDFSGYDLVIKAKSITLLAEDEDSRMMVHLSRAGGCQVVDAQGSGLFAKDGKVNLKTVDPDGNLKASLVITQDSISLSEIAAGCLKLKNGNATLTGQKVSLNFITALALGAKASPATPVTLGAVGASAVGSTCIWGALNP